MSRYTPVQPKDRRWYSCTVCNDGTPAAVLVDAEPMDDYRGEALCVEHAGPAVPYLLAAIRRLRAELAQVHDELCTCGLDFLDDDTVCPTVGVLDDTEHLTGADQ